MPLNIILTDSLIIIIINYSVDLQSVNKIDYK